MAVRNTAGRRREMAELLVSEGSVQIAALVKRFGVSRETVRKDLLALESQGIGRKNRGGAFLRSSVEEVPFESRFEACAGAKLKIARAAAARIPEGATVLLDSGSTTYELARLLTLRRGLTILTNSAVIPPVLAGSGNTVFALGGELRSLSKACVGMWTLSALRTVKSDVAFIGADGVLLRGGPCTAVYAEAEVKKAMAANAGEAILVCDGSKLERDSVIQFCDWSDIACLITDDHARPEQVAALREVVDVVVAE